jgi:hypothetical protein
MRRPTMVSTNPRSTVHIAVGSLPSAEVSERVAGGLVLRACIAVADKSNFNQPLVVCIGKPDCRESLT